MTLDLTNLENTVLVKAVRDPDQRQCVFLARHVGDEKSAHLFVGAVEVATGQAAQQVIDDLLKHDMICLLGIVESTRLFGFEAEVATGTWPQRTIDDLLKRGMMGPAWITEQYTLTTLGNDAATELLLCDELDRLELPRVDDPPRTSDQE